MEEKIVIRISTDYSETLGARNISDGTFSGEDFRENFLIPRFHEAQETGKKIVVDFDGGYGNPVSFLEEAFGGLARKFGTEKVIDTFEFISNDEAGLIEEIRDYIMHPYENRVYKRFLEQKKQGKRR